MEPMNPKTGCSLLLIGLFLLFGLPFILLFLAVVIESIGFGI